MSSFWSGTRPLRSKMRPRFYRHHERAKIVEIDECGVLFGLQHQQRWRGREATMGVIAYMEFAELGRIDVLRVRPVDLALRSGNRVMQMSPEVTTG
jgi:hypothetical protein